MTITLSPTSKTHLNSNKGRLRGRTDRKDLASLEAEAFRAANFTPVKALSDFIQTPTGPDTLIRLKYNSTNPTDPQGTITLSIETEKTGEPAVTKVSFSNIGKLTEEQWELLAREFRTGANQAEAVTIGKALEVALGSKLNLDIGLSIENTTVSGANLHREALSSRTYNEVTWVDSSLRSDLSHTVHNGGGMKNVDACRANLTDSKFTNKFEFDRVKLVAAILNGVEIGVDCKFNNVNIQDASCIGMKIDGMLLTDFIKSSTPDQIKTRLKGVVYSKKTKFCDTSTDAGAQLQKEILEILDRCSVVYTPGAASDRGLLTKENFLNRLANDLGVTTMTQGSTMFIPLASISRMGSLGVTMKDSRNPQEGGFGTLRHYGDDGKVTNIPVTEKNINYPLDVLEAEIYRILNRKRGVMFDPNEVDQLRVVI